MRIAAGVKTIAERHGATPAQVALAWLLAKGEDVVPVPGTKRRVYLEENVAAAELTLTAAEREQLDAALPPTAGPRYSAIPASLIDRRSDYHPAVLEPRRTGMLVAASLLLLLPGGGRCRPAAAPSACAGTRDLVHVTLAAKPDTSLRLEPDPELGEAQLLRELDLDGRGGPDLLIWFPATHGSGGTMFALLARCGGDTYRPVWGPEYAVELEPTATRAGGWLIVDRIEDATSLRSGPRARRIHMQYRAGAYRDQPARPKPSR